MLKLFLIILAAVYVVAFAMDNLHRVELGLIVGRPVHVRLFFLLLTSFLIGWFTAVFIRLCLTAKARKRQETAQDKGSDNFFSE